LQAQPIKLLSSQLANQIAAGEVVERPASVVKELLENSIDAGATRIEVDIERGGTRLIRITDNGHGIDKDSLTLALTRHATSKIDSIDDLSAIQSLGFRGEALASISSVSKLSLTSRTLDSDLAWQATAQGRDMQVDITPASALVGTRIEVNDLFFNTPARQKFLRTEKTEFNHIEEVFKRQALANPGISFVLKHNGKIAKRIPASLSDKNSPQRLKTICGKKFVDQCVEFFCEHESIQIFGWLGKPSFHRSESDIQYSFINKRAVKDKTLTHAIRESYDGQLPPGRLPAYVIFLKLDPEKVDVNVHPTKHEVRFGEQRLVHDLLVKSLTEALEQASKNDFKPHSFELDDYHDAAAFINEDNEQDKTMAFAKGAEESEWQHGNSPPMPPSVASSHQTRSNSPLQKAYTSETLANVWGDLSKGSRNEVRAQIKEPYPGYISDSELNPSLPLIRLDKSYYITQIDKKTVVIDACGLFKDYLALLLSQTIQVETRPLLFPKALGIDSEFLEEAESYQLFSDLGFELKAGLDKTVHLTKIPIWLNHLENEVVFTMLQSWFELEAFNRKNLLPVITDSFSDIPTPLIQLLISSMDSKLLAIDCWREIKPELLLDLFTSNTH
jgi:DNA mismatch repair protein MutL